MKPKRWMAAVPVAAAVLVGALILSRRPQTRPAPPLQQRRAALRIPLERFERESAAAPAGPLRYGYRRGDVLRYRFESANEIAFRLNNLVQGQATAPSSAEPQRMTSRWGGALDLVCYDSGGDFQLGWRFRGIFLELSANGAAADRTASQSMAAEMSREILVTMSYRGEIREFLFPKAMSVEARNLIKGLILQLRFVLPEEKREHWETQEEDTTGKYDASYVAEAGYRLRDRVGVRIERTKLRYANVFTRGAGKNRATVEGSCTGYFDSTRGRFRQIESDERIRVIGIDSPQEVEVATTGAVVLESELRDESLTPLEFATRCARADRRRASGPEWGAALAGAIEEAHLRELIEGKTLETYLGALGYGFAVPDAWETLAAFLKLDPSAAGKLREFIEGQEAPLALRILLTDVLANGGCRAELLALLDRSMEPEVRVHAVLGLSLSSTPSPDTDEAIVRVISGPTDDPVTHAGVLGLGILASRTDSPDRLLTALREAESRSADVSWKALYLSALGNAARPESLGDIERYLVHEDPVLRESAVDALRSIRIARADEILEIRLKSDESPRVRARAAETLAARGGGAALERALLDPAEEVRGAALSYFGGRVATDPNARRLVEGVAAGDSSPDLRRQAASILAQIP